MVSNVSDGRLRLLICLSICVVISLFPISDLHATDECVLRMGYRTNKREPLIKKDPDNRGLYYQLYSIAAQKIGCKLEVVRKPKKRILKDMKLGKIDFYPGFNFTEERATYTFYIENGLPGGDIGLSLADQPEVTDLSQLIQRNMTLLSAYGSAEFIKEVKKTKIHELDLDKAALLLRKKRADFYIYNKSSLEYFLMKNRLKGFRLHQKCCGGIKPLYLGFSRKSKHLKSVKNPDYDTEKPLAVENFPVRTAPDCVAARLAEVLAEMKSSGETARIYESYYGYPMK